MTDDLIKRLEMWGDGSELSRYFIGQKTLKEDCAEAAQALRDTIPRTEALAMQTAAYEAAADFVREEAASFPDTVAWAVVDLATAIRALATADQRAALDRLIADKMAEATTLAARDVLAERRRQISAEGWTPEHDDAHDKGEMAQAAGCYALNAAGWKTEALRGCWPLSWRAAWFKPANPRRDLVKAAALILAEIERLDRAALKGGA